MTVPAPTTGDLDADAAEGAGVAVIGHLGLCQGHGLCQRWAPSVYHLDEEGYLDVHRMAVPPELTHDARLGATVCPAHAITVVTLPGRA